MARWTRRYLIRQAVVVLLTLFAVTLPSLLLIHLPPIDPATTYVKHNPAIITQEQIDEARAMLGLDKPLPVQYPDWVMDTLHMDFDISLGAGNPTMEESARTIPVTLTMVAYSTAIVSLGVLGVGMLGYLWRQKAEGMILSFLTMIGISAPDFYLGIAFIDLLAVRLSWISILGNSGSARCLPVAFCLSILGVCFYGQMLAASLEREMEQGYVMYLRCRGLRGRRILLLHAFPHAVVDLLPSFAQMLGLCLANTATVERIFSLSELDCLIIGAVVKRDSLVIHVVVLVLVLTLVLLDTATELLQYGLRSDTWAAGGQA